MSEYALEYETEMLIKIQTLIDKPDFKELYQVGFDMLGTPRVCVVSDFGQYNQIVTLGVYDYGNNECMLSWGHVFPRLSKNVSIVIGTCSDDMFRTAKLDDIQIRGLENIKKAQFLHKTFRYMRYGDNVVKKAKKTNPQLGEALEELARNHYTDPEQDYGLKLLDIFLQHVK